MAIGLAADLAEEAGSFLEEFGGSMIYTPSGGSASNITGMFLDPHEIVEIDGKEFSTQTYSVIVESADVESVALGDTITVEAVVYNVIDIQPMQTGLTRLELQRQ